MNINLLKSKKFSVGIAVFVVFAVIFLSKAAIFQKNSNTEQASLSTAFNVVDSELNDLDNSVSVGSAEVDLKKKYTNSKYGFSLNYPDSLSVVTSTEADSGEVLLFDGSGNRGFQIFITRGGDIGDITPDLITNSIPDISIKNPQVAIIGGDLRALIFVSYDQIIGETREVWFSEGDFLYQITAYLDYDAELAQILSTWNFI